jgi:hypothetical protein
VRDLHTAAGVAVGGVAGAGVAGAGVAGAGVAGAERVIIPATMEAVVRRTTDAASGGAP